MKTSKIGRALLVLFVLTSCFSVASQQPSAPPFELSDFKAPDWRRRSAAYEKIKASDEALQRSDVKSALSGLLDRENQVIRMTLTNSNGKVGVSEKYGEQYSEYYADLLGNVAKIADWHDQNQLCILAEGSYSPDSPFAGRVAVEGGAAVVPCLLKIAQGSMYDRQESIPVLVQLFSVTNDLSRSDRRRIQQTITAGLRDSDVSVRLSTVQAVGKFGDSQMIPALQDIVHLDQYSRLLDNGQRRFDVRDAAAKAIQSIQERAKAH